MTPEQFAESNVAVGFLRHELRRHLGQVEMRTAEADLEERRIADSAERIVATRRKIAEHERAVVDIRTALASLGVLESLEEE